MKAEGQKQAISGAAMHQMLDLAVRAFSALPAFWHAVLAALRATPPMLRTADVGVSLPCPPPADSKPRASPSSEPTRPRAP